MPRKPPSAKLVLWADLHVTVYGPAGTQAYRMTRRRVDVLINSFAEVIRECMKDQARQFPVLKVFRVRVQS